MLSICLFALDKKNTSQIFITEIFFNPWMAFTGFLYKYCLDVPVTRNNASIAWWGKANKNCKCFRW